MSFLIKLFSSNDHKTTFLGSLLAILQVMHVDWSKVFAGDPVEAGKAAGAVVTFLLGYFTNKPSKKA